MKSFQCDRLNLDGPFNGKVIPCLEFTIEFQSNKLIYQKEYTKRQQIIYLLIHHLHDREGWGYQKISNWLNKSSILTHTGKKWFSSSVISVLKRKHDHLEALLFLVHIFLSSTEEYDSPSAFHLPLYIFFSKIVSYVPSLK